jgi:hypothetical protein
MKKALEETIVKVYDNKPIIIIYDENQLSELKEFIKANKFRCE